MRTPQTPILKFHTATDNNVPRYNVYNSFARSAIKRLVTVNNQFNIL